MKGHMRISKKEWQARGGCENPQLFRKHSKAGWRYYLIVW